MQAPLFRAFDALAGPRALRPGDDRGGGAAGAEDVHQAVDDLALIDMTSVAAALGRRNQRHDMRPFRVGQIARIAQPTAVVASAIFVGPHRRPLPPAIRAAFLES